jgi:quercetin dioxygenase-like cupin family protein
MRKPLLAILLCLPLTALADDLKPARNADDASWGPAPAVLPKGAQMAVLFGDPTKPGLFIARLKMPAGYKIPAHQHPTDEHLTIVSGSFHGGMGDKLDESKGMKLETGGFISLPAKMNHFAWTTEPSIVEIASDGPFAMTYVSASDDPTRSN